MVLVHAERKVFSIRARARAPPDDKWNRSPEVVILFKMRKMFQFMNANPSLCFSRSMVRSFSICNHLSFINYSILERKKALNFVCHLNAQVFYVRGA